MKKPRVKRGRGPKNKLTEGNYRKKALPFLLNDFEKRCAYCLDPDDFRHPWLNHVEHFNCKLNGRRRHHYSNLMLACAACNLSKHDKPTVNIFDKEQRLLNCTEETEFPEHIIETKDGQWEPRTKAGEYHLAILGLQENCHKAKRAQRRTIAEQIFGLCTQAVQYESQNPAAVQRQLMDTLRALVEHLDAFPPLVTDRGLVAVREWLASKGVDTRLFDPGPVQAV